MRAFRRSYRSGPLIIILATTRLRQLVRSVRVGRTGRWCLTDYNLSSDLEETRRGVSSTPLAARSEGTVLTEDDGLSRAASIDGLSRSRFDQSAIGVGAADAGRLVQ